MISTYHYFKELYIALGIIFIIAVVGSMGYMFLEDYTLGEALYMTIITVSTVGFKEVRDLSELGRYFTIFLIITSFGTFAFAISSVSKYIFTGTYAIYFKKYKMENKISNLDNHVVICGYGSNGVEAINRLIALQKDIVAIESDPDKIELLREEGILFVEGDATDESTLIHAGIESAGSLITTLPKDTDNVFVVLTAREINPQLKIVTRAAIDSSKAKLRIAGADAIIMPDKVGGARMAGFIINQNINRFLDKVAITDQKEKHIAEIISSELPSSLKTASVGEVIDHYGTNCLLIGMRKGTGEYVVNPEPDTPVSEGCELFFLGTTEQIKNLKGAND